MSLLTDNLPMAICRVGDVLMWDTEADNADEVFNIAVSYRSILAIFDMMNTPGLTDREKQWCMLRMFYLDNVPQDYNRADELANEFMQCGKGIVDKKQKEPCYYSWTQDGDYIYAAINQTFDGILKKEPDLHWFEFVNCFMCCTNPELRINEIICNRAAYHKGKTTKEQKEARRLYPEIYVLRETRKSDNETTNRAKELERLMNA